VGKVECKGVIVGKAESLLRKERTKEKVWGITQGQNDGK